jgi:seryl-tRNA synthetase
MDPGTIIVVVQIAGEVTLTLGRYIKRAKDAKDEVLNLQKKAQDLQKTLEEIDSLRKDGNDSRLATLQSLSDDMKRCQTTLANFQQNLDDKTSKFKKILGKENLKWPFQRGECNNLVVEIEGYQKRFTDALRIDQT